MQSAKFWSPVGGRENRHLDPVTGASATLFFLPQADQVYSDQSQRDDQHPSAAFESCGSGYMVS